MNYRASPILAALVAAFALTGYAGAQEEPLVGDRPDFTESAQTIAPRRVQVEAGTTYVEGDESETLSLGELLVRVGLHELVELRVGLNSYVDVNVAGGPDSSGLVDSTLGVKIALGELLGWTTATLIGTTLPTGDSLFGDSSWRPSAVFVAERDLSCSTSLGTNFGYVYNRADGERFDEWAGSAALGFTLTESIGSFVEVFGFVPMDGGGPETYFFDAGLTKSLSPNLQLDLRAGVGLNSAADDWFTGAGLIWRH